MIFGCISQIKTNCVQNKTKTAKLPFLFLVKYVVLIIVTIVCSWRCHCVDYCDAIQNAFAVVVVVTAIFYVAVDSLIFFHKNHLLLLFLATIKIIYTC